MGTTDVRSTLAHMIRVERMKRRWTRARLAELLGVSSPSTIGNWECGIAAPDCDKIYLMADLFNVSIDYLFGHQQHGDEDGPDVRGEDFFSGQIDTLRKIGACDEVGQAAILNCIDFHYERCVNARPDKGKNSTGIQRVFLDKDKDPEYEEIKRKLPELRSLKRAKKKSLMNITEHLWEIGYGSEICLAFVMEIFGLGLNERVPCHRLYKDIENYLKGNYRVFSE